MDDRPLFCVNGFFTSGLPSSEAKLNDLVNNVNGENTSDLIHHLVQLYLEASRLSSLFVTSPVGPRLEWADITSPLHYAWDFAIEPGTRLIAPTELSASIATDASWARGGPSMGRGMMRLFPNPYYMGDGWRFEVRLHHVMPNLTFHRKGAVTYPRNGVIAFVDTFHTGPHLHLETIIDFNANTSESVRRATAASFPPNLEDMLKGIAHNPLTPKAKTLAIAMSPYYFLGWPKPQDIPLCIFSPTLASECSLSPPGTLAGVVTSLVLDHSFPEIVSVIDSAGAASFSQPTSARMAFDSLKSVCEKWRIDKNPLRRDLLDFAFSGDWNAEPLPFSSTARKNWSSIGEPTTITALLGAACRRIGPLYGRLRNRNNPIDLRSSPALSTEGLGPSLTSRIDDDPFNAAWSITGRFESRNNYSYWWHDRVDSRSFGLSFGYIQFNQKGGTLDQLIARSAAVVPGFSEAFGHRVVQLENIRSINFFGADEEDWKQRFTWLGNQESHKALQRELGRTLYYAPALECLLRYFAMDEISLVDIVLAFDCAVQFGVDTGARSYCRTLAAFVSEEEDGGRMTYPLDRGSYASPATYAVQLDAALGRLRAFLVKKYDSMPGGHNRRGRILEMQELRRPVTRAPASAMKKYRARTLINASPAGPSVAFITKASSATAPQPHVPAAPAPTVPESTLTPKQTTSPPTALIIDVSPFSTGNSRPIPLALRPAQPSSPPTLSGLLELKTGLAGPDSSSKTRNK